MAISIVDESHNLAGRDSHLARAGHLAMRAAARVALQELETTGGPNGTAMMVARTALAAADTQRAAAQAALAEAQAWADARDLEGHYRHVVGVLEAKLKARDAGSAAARLAQGNIPRWFAALPCAAPPFSVTYTKKGEWGDAEEVTTLLTTPVLAWEHVYPLERRLREIVQTERAEARPHDAAWQAGQLQGRGCLSYTETGAVRSSIPPRPSYATKPPTDAKWRPPEQTPVPRPLELHPAPAPATEATSSPFRRR